MAELFPKEFVAATTQMRLSAGPVPRGGRHAEHGSVQLGPGMEFRDFRSYMPGDDIRRIDWNLYRRSGRLFLRLFEEERDLPVYILLDCSDSMFFEESPSVRPIRVPLSRADAAKQAASTSLRLKAGMDNFNLVAGAETASPAESAGARWPIWQLLLIAALALMTTEAVLNIHRKIS